MMGKTLRSKKGFSLLEVLVGLMLMAIGLLAVVALHVSSVKGNFSSHSLMQATYIAQDRLEFLGNLPFGSNQLLANTYDEGATTVAGVSYGRRYTVVDTVASELKTITYTVTWNDGFGHQVSFTTRKAS